MASGRSEAVVAAVSAASWGVREGLPSLRQLGEGDPGSLR